MKSKNSSNLARTSLISLDDLSPSDISLLFQKARKRTRAQPLKGVLIALLFFEPSTRTFSSFAAAAKRLGAQTLEFQNASSTSSAVKGETIEDTIRTIQTYTDLIVIRHPEVGSVRRAHTVATVPIINAGDGSGEHPTQALQDMYTLHRRFGKLDGITGLLAGDLKHGRTIHSLIAGLAKYRNITLYLLSPASLKLPDAYTQQCSNVTFKLIRNISQVPKSCHFWYWTRVQKERFSNLAQYEKVKHAYILSRSLVDRYAGAKTVFMHPLPRVGELHEDLDGHSNALYFTEQIRSGLDMRSALMCTLLGR